MTVEYDTADFFCEYGTRSIGWENVENRPMNRANRWINKQAQEGWKLLSLTSEHPTRVVVVLQREVDRG